MGHFEGITPEQRWKNDVLEELQAIRKILERQEPTQVGSDKKEDKPRMGRPPLKR
ncbi:hypothetical protein [Paenibacillus qinlingensis]|uniref:Transposase n=1 Tax=Paenibacillus qinlingensis TaxID=1837343 RepID=A0ABU1P6Q3_9BACL|nr:hypothetical protein [Paenibacillus qinlingensis]MDR6555436.1 hypothetical protein [Paenibacillus qinlingensis]